MTEHAAQPGSQTRLDRPSAWEHSVAFSVQAVWTLRAVQPGMVALGVFIVFLYGFFAPSREVFAATVEAWRSGEIAPWALVVHGLLLFLLSAVLFEAHRAFARPSRRLHDGGPPAFYQRPWVKGLSGGIGLLVTLSPWIGVALGFWSAADVFDQLRETSAGIFSDFSVELDATAPTDGGDRIKSFAPHEATANALALAVVALGAVVFVVLWALATYGPKLALTRGLRLCLLWAAPLAWFAIALGPLFFAASALDLTIWLDPVAGGTTAAYFVVAFFVFVGRLGRRFGQPSIFVFAGFFALAVAMQWIAPTVQSTLRNIGLLAEMREARTAPDASPDTAGASDQADANSPACRSAWRGEAEKVLLENRFAAWSRDLSPTEEGRPIPVFVVAARGGGAYAAIAASAFLARMDHAHPDFTRHVFAISAVSGGAVGVASLRALATAPKAEPAAPRPASDFIDLLTQIGRPKETANDGIDRNDEITAAQKREAAVLRALTDGHMAPILAFLGADIFRKYLPFLPNDPDSAPTRATAFERSLRRALGAEREGGEALPTFREAVASRDAPALIFPTTSSELGIRAAFAPFDLGPVGDGTLKRFEELDDALCVEDFADIDLVGAASASARFPLVLPAYTLPSRDLDGVRYNFVDGGVADATGIVTALEVFEALERLPQVETGRFEPHLIVFSDRVASERSLSDLEGQRLSDTGAMLSAILNLRSLLARRGLERARAAFSGEYGRRLYVVEIDRRNVDMPLGWRMSQATAGTIALQMGRPQWAGELRADRTINEHSDAGRIVNANSCVAADLVDLLAEGETPGRQGCPPR